MFLYSTFPRKIASNQALSNDSLLGSVLHEGCISKEHCGMFNYVTRDIKYVEF